jgi:uncharacterized protein (UPF0332 family)
MTTANVKALVMYRLEQADESLEAASVLLDQGLIRPSVNRAYYAMFYAVLALLAGKRKETSKHSGAISLFDREFVKTGIFPKYLSRWLHGAFDLRQRTDYETQMQVSKEESVRILKEAREFISEVRAKIIEHELV